MKTIGVLGNGQLGAMLALAGYPLGLRFRFFSPEEGAPTAGFGDQVIAPYDDRAAMTRFAKGLDAVTFEFENVELAALAELERQAVVHPPVKALSVSQDRITEKNFFAGLGARLPQYAAVSSEQELSAAVQRIGLPAILKTRRFGYDGKGQAVLRTEADLAKAWQELGRATGGLVLESMVTFDREVSLMSVRAKSGEIAFYPLVENHHESGILSRTIAPAPNLDQELQAEAQSIATKALEALDYVGVLVIEFFQVGANLLVNEMAPRVHNSGHWTIEGAVTSQFENHIRAVAGLPLGSTALRGTAILVNLVGTCPDPAAVLSLADTHLHLYGKTARPRRKLGHITVIGATAEAAQRTLAELEAKVGRIVVS